MIKRAADYGAGHLSSIRSDMDGKDYNAVMRNDMETAIALLRAAPLLEAALIRARPYVKNAGADSLLAEINAAIAAAGK